MGQGWERIVEGLNSLDGLGGSIEVEGENVAVREGEGKTLAFLDVEVALKLKTGGRVAFETGVYRKASAGNTYTHWKSACTDTDDDTGDDPGHVARRITTTPCADEE